MYRRVLDNLILRLVALIKRQAHLVPKSSRSFVKNRKTESLHFLLFERLDLQMPRVARVQFWFPPLSHTAQVTDIPRCDMMR